MRNMVLKNNVTKLVNKSSIEHKFDTYIKREEEIKEEKKVYLVNINTNRIIHSLVSPLHT